ncbi:MAG: quercetin 2,3-dioxygenase, partial [Frankiales bacterium]|nr:quercetin 2,3-dioxygenase [Frankiales bacterium]
NDERLAPGAGFDEHSHAGLVLVTYVVSGSLAHEGVMSSTVSAGQVAVLRAGTGVLHSERNLGETELRFLQTWISCLDDSVSYDVLDVGELAPVATVRDARVLVGTLRAGSTVELSGHVTVVSGQVGELTDGDSLRASRPVALTAGTDAVLIAVTW